MKKVEAQTAAPYTASIVTTMGRWPKNKSCCSGICHERSAMLVPTADPVPKGNVLMVACHERKDELTIPIAGASEGQDLGVGGWSTAARTSTSNVLPKNSCGSPAQNLH